MKQINKQGVHAVMVGGRVAVTIKSGRRDWTGIILDFGGQPEVIKRPLDTPQKAKDFLRLRAKPKRPVVDANTLDNIG